MNTEEICGCCGESTDDPVACKNCGAERYEDLDGRVYYEGGQVLTEWQGEEQDVADDVEDDFDTEDAYLVENDGGSEFEQNDPNAPSENKSDEDHERISEGKGDGDNGEVPGSEGDGDGDGEGDGEGESDSDSEGDESEGEGEGDEGDDEQEMKTCPECNGECDDDEGEPCPNCNGTGEVPADEDGDEDGDSDDDEGDEDSDEDSDDDNIEIEQREYELEDDEDPFPDGKTLRILGIDPEKKWDATQWLLSVTEMRDGKPYPEAECQSIVEQIISGKKADIEEIPPSALDLVEFAAVNMGVELDRVEPEPGEMFALYGTDCDRDRKIQSIKGLRDGTGMIPGQKAFGLKIAKEAVDKLVQDDSRVLIGEADNEAILKDVASRMQEHGWKTHIEAA